MIHFGVIHATYRERHTMPETVASLYAAGVPHVTLFPDNGVYGAMRNVDRALRRLIELAQDGDFVCVVDDDLAVCRDALLIMEKGLKGSAVRSFYTVEHTIRHLTDEEKAATRWKAVSPTFADGWGGMVVMPRDIAQQVIEHTWWRRYAQTEKVGKHCDAALYETLGQLGKWVDFHIPSLATDISGGSSTLGTENKNVLAGFRFEEWQAPTP